jgi:hypothetical protein
LIKPFIDKPFDFRKGIYISQETTTVVKAMISPRPNLGRGGKEIETQMIEVTAKDLMQRQEIMRNTKAQRKKTIKEREISQNSIVFNNAKKTFKRIPYYMNEEGRTDNG